MGPGRASPPGAVPLLFLELFLGVLRLLAPCLLLFLELFLYILKHLLMPPLLVRLLLQLLLVLALQFLLGPTPDQFAVDDIVSAPMKCAHISSNRPHYLDPLRVLHTILFFSNGIWVVCTEGSPC